MIICPNCNHQNPGGAVQCEACYTPLPSMLDCPKCGAPVQSDASFCGQCGANLAGASTPKSDPHHVSTPNHTSTLNASDALTMDIGSEQSDIASPLESPPRFSVASPIPDLDLPDVQVPDLSTPPKAIEPPPFAASPPEQPKSIENESTPIESSMASSLEPEQPIPRSNAPSEYQESSSSEPSHPPLFQSTQLQSHVVQLIHTHTNTALDIPQHLNIIHIGKPNDRVPPDIDVSGFQDSEVVSRVHADIRIEGEAYYLEDMGSSNGTYVNNVPLLRGNRHRLRSGDRIALGKGDKVSFIVQIAPA